MDIQKAITLIEKKERIGIILPHEPSVDGLVSAEVLFRVLEERKKRIGLLSSPQFPPALDTRCLSRILASPPLSKEFIISLDTAHSPISELRYEEEAQRLNIILSPKSRPIEAGGILFREGKVQCECVITLGIENIEERARSLDTRPDFFLETPIINIDISSRNKTFGEANLVDDTRSSLAEITYQLVSSIIERPLDGESATLILAGTVEQTKTFRSPRTGAGSLLLASELLRLGADMSRAREISREAIPQELIQLFGRAAVRSKIDPRRGVLWSFLTAEDFEKTGRSAKDVMSILARLESELPAKNTAALLWQNPEDKTVYVTLGGNQETLERIRAGAPAAFQSPYLQISNSFATFREAEDYTTSLIDAVL